MITLDFAPEKQAVIEQASQIAGMAMSDFIQENAYQMALEMLNNRQIWQVTSDQMKVIEIGLKDDSPANTELKTLLALVN